MAPTRRIIITASVVLIVAASLLGLVYFVGPGEGAKGGAPVRNVLIISSITGFNDSADHGVPTNPWPIVQVAKGTLVNFTVYNSDKQAHGFQVAHYDAQIETIAPGQTIHVSFIANETGTFKIYCSIFCTVHWAMQSGELIVD